MSKRPPNEIESKLHQAILSRPNQRVTMKQVESIVTDPIARKNALNFLLGVGLLISVDKSSTIRAVTHEEFTQSRDLGEEENAILRLIRASKNEGIWSKYLKSKTNLSKPTIEHCLRSLVAKKLVKRVSSVHHTMRKIYMLEGITPSVTLTGGPWYTDNELDIDFIRHLTAACLKIIRTLTYPKQTTGSTKGVLYAPSSAPQYPTAVHILNSLRNAQLTNTTLSVGDVTKLLDILILDGEIERIPILGPQLRVSDDETAGEQSGRSSRKKRKRASSYDGDPSSTKHRHMESTEEPTPHKDLHRSARQVARTGTSKYGRLSSGTGKALDTTDSSADEPGPQGTSQSGPCFLRPGDPESGDFLYRAINSEQPRLGWLESPCNHCSALEFCKAGGPVNPSNCPYFDNWIMYATSPSLPEIF